MPTRLILATLLAVVTVTACGDREPVDHPAAPPSAAGQGDGESWWLLDAPGFELVAGEATPEEISSQTGSLWMLEYSNAGQTLRLVADRAGGLFSQLSTASPEVGRVQLDEGVEAILRQHPGRPEEGIPPSVGAEWTHDDVFVSFGGPGFTEPVVRELLTHVRSVTREEWQAAAAALPPPAGSEAPVPLPPEGVAP